MYYSLIGTLLTVLIGIIVSYLTQDPKDSYDAKLLHPLVFKICQRFTGEKPYYVKEIETIASSAGSNGNISSGIGSGGIGSGSDSGAKINHAFEAQNETNIIIGVVGNNHNDKEKNPMEAIFTKSQTNVPTASATTANAANPLTNRNTNTNTNSNTATTAAAAAITTKNSHLTIEIPKIQKIFSNNDNNQTVSNDISGSYRQITEKEMV